MFRVKDTVNHALFYKAIDALSLLQKVSIDEGSFWIIMADVEGGRRMLVEHVHRLAFQCTQIQMYCINILCYTKSLDETFHLKFASCKPILRQTRDIFAPRRLANKG